MHRLAERGRITARWIVGWVVNGLNNLLPDDRLSRALRRCILRMAGAHIGRGAVVIGGTYVSIPSNLRMGARSGIFRGCYLDLHAPITLGDDVIVGHGTTIITAVHAIGSTTRRAGPVTGKPVTIGAGAWIGANVTILPGVTIGPGAVVGACAVVSRDVTANMLVVGSPARRVRRLDVDPAVNAEATVPSCVA